MPPASLVSRVQETVVNLQFAWACGHLATVLSTCFYFNKYFYPGIATKYYTIAFLGAFVSYAVVVWKTFGVPQLNPVFMQRFLIDENVHYLMLTVIWLISPVYSVALLPYFTFSLFHLLNFLRTSILPVFFPELKLAPAPRATEKKSIAVRMSELLQSAAHNNFRPAMSLVAYVEVVGVMGSLIIGAITFKSIFAPFFYAHFLRLRFGFSPETQRVFANIRELTDSTFVPPKAHPKMPAMVTKVYTVIREYLIAYGQAVIQREQAPTTR